MTSLYLNNQTEAQYIKFIYLFNFKLVARRTLYSTCPCSKKSNNAHLFCRTKILKLKVQLYTPIWCDVIHDIWYDMVYDIWYMIWYFHSLWSFQALQSPATPLTLFHDLLVFLISSSVVFRHVLFSLPHLLYPWGFQSNAVFSIAPVSLHNVCPIQFHFLLFIWFSIDFWWVILHSSSFVILLVHFIFIIRPKQKCSKHLEEYNKLIIKQEFVH